MDCTALFLCRLITLLFNVEYHPPSQPTTCKSVDVVRVLSEIVGESHHHDHHVHPQRARRPGMDLAYTLFVLPLLKVGLVRIER